MIWSNASLGPGRHTATHTHDDDNPDVVLSFGQSSIRWSDKDKTSYYPNLPPRFLIVRPTNQNQANRVPLAVGLTLSLLTLVVGVFLVVFATYTAEEEGRRFAPTHNPFLHTLSLR